MKSQLAVPPSETGNRVNALGEDAKICRKLAPANGDHHLAWVRSDDSSSLYLEKSLRELVEGVRYFATVPLSRRLGHKEVLGCT